MDIKKYSIHNYYKCMLAITPYRQQQSGLCGPAALKMVLSYFGIEKNEEELAMLSEATPEKGVEAQGLIHAAKQLGLQGFYKDHAMLDDIRASFIHRNLALKGRRLV